MFNQAFRSLGELSQNVIRSKLNPNSLSALVKANPAYSTSAAGPSDDVNFYEMVEMFFDRAATIVEDKWLKK